MPVGGIVVWVGMKPLWLATTRKRLWRVRAPRTNSSQLSEIAWVKKSRFTPLCFISLQSIYEDLFWLCIYFAKQSKYFFINSLGNSRNLWHYQWPAEFIKQRKPASKWHQIALYERWIFFLFCFFCCLGFFFFFFFFFLVGCEQPYYFEIHGTIIETLWKKMIIISECQK